MLEPELDYVAISIDSNTFRGAGYNFEGGVLKLLEQFKDSPVRVVQTDVVFNEGLNHVAKDAADCIGKVRSGARLLSKYRGADRAAKEEMLDALGVNDDPRAIAKARVEDFYSRIGAEVISSSIGVDVEELMDMYFSLKAPFEGKADKKHEFPDAVALLTLECWANLHGNVVVVTKDKGWHKFIASRPFLHAVEDLSEAMELFQPHTKVAAFVEFIRREDLLDLRGDVSAEIESAIEGNVSRQHPLIEASAYFHYDYQDVELMYSSHFFHEDKADGGVAVKVVLIEEKCVVLQAKATVFVDVSVSFDFSVHDSIDDDYVSIGGSYNSIGADYDVDVLIHFSGDWTDHWDGVSVSHVEVVGELKRVDFGGIEPDFSSDVDEEYVSVEDDGL